MISKNQSKTTGQRLVSVDALRGFDMFWIIGGSELLITLAIIAVLFIVSNIDSIESSIGRTKQALNCCKSLPAFINVGLLGKNRKEAIRL